LPQPSALVKLRVTVIFGEGHAANSHLSQLHEARKQTNSRSKSYESKNEGDKISVNTVTDSELALVNATGYEMAIVGSQ